MRITTLGAALAIASFAASGAFAEGTTSPSTSPGTSAGQNQAFCLEKSAGEKSCIYATMAACEAAKAGSDKCSPNPAASTTGAGTGGAGGSPMSPSTPSR
jgi:hypothetical protein